MKIPEHRHRGARWAFCALALAACSPTRYETVSRAGEPDVAQVPRTDTAMAAAILAARASVAGFVAQVWQPAVPFQYAAIKVRLADGETGEHIWATNPTLVAGGFRAVLDNAPLNKQWHLGDTVRVSIDSISDWMLVRGDTLFGGYTIYVLREAMSADEQVQFNKSQRDQGVLLGATPRALSSAR